MSRRRGRRGTCAARRGETLKELLAEIRGEIGPATEEETQWARSVLGL